MLLSIDNFSVEKDSKVLIYIDATFNMNFITIE